jgi:hypothetical protein
MYAIDIGNKTDGRIDIFVFDDMLAWLSDVVGPKLSEDQRTVELAANGSKRTFKIEGTGWYYEYCSIRISTDDTREFELPKFFHDAGRRAGGSNLYTSKVMYIEDLIYAVEFKLLW